MQSKQTLSKAQYSKIVSIQKQLKTSPSIIHNLTVIKLPTNVQILLSLGLKFCMLQYPNFNKVEEAFEEGLRKVSWINYFKDRGDEKILSNLDKFIINRKKKNSDVGGPCDIQNQIFPNANIKSDFLNLVKKNSSKQSFVPKDVIQFIFF